MADVLTLSGSLTQGECATCPDASPEIALALTAKLPVKASWAGRMVLSTDAPVAVPFSTLAGAHAVHLRVRSGGKVRARLTSGEGSAQAIPVEGEFLLLSAGDAPVTAIDLTRLPGVETTVDVFLAEKP